MKEILLTLLIICDLIGVCAGIYAIYCISKIKQSNEKLAQRLEKGR